MKVLTILENIENNQAKIYDFKNEEYYQIELSDDEETGVRVIYNTETNQIDTVDNESELF